MPATTKPALWYSRPSVNVLRVEISSKANLPLAQIPPLKRRDARNATSVVFLSFDVSCLCGRASTHQEQYWTGLMLPASDGYRTRRWPARAGSHGECTGMCVIHDYNFRHISIKSWKHNNVRWPLGNNSHDMAVLGCHDGNPGRRRPRRGSHNDSPHFIGNLKHASHYRWSRWQM